MQHHMSVQKRQFLCFHRFGRAVLCVCVCRCLSVCVFGTLSLYVNSGLSFPSFLSEEFLSYISIDDDD